MGTLRFLFTRVLPVTGLLALAAGVALWRACLDGCGNEVHHWVSSPNGERRAYAYVRGCGATSRDVNWVAMLDAEDELGNRPGNVLGIEPPTGAGLYPVKIEWLSDSQLQVTYPVRSMVFRKFESVDGVHVSFVEEQRKR